MRLEATDCHGAGARRAARDARRRARSADAVGQRPSQLARPPARRPRRRRVRRERTSILAGDKGWPHDPARRGPTTPTAGLAAAERAGAWSAWRTAAADLGPEALIRLVGDAGLRGRGGGGYPTGRQVADLPRAAVGRRATSSPTASRPTPARATDRTLMESDPHARPRGRRPGRLRRRRARAPIVAVRADATVAVRRLRGRAAGGRGGRLLGIDALGTGIDVHVEVRELQGALRRRRGDGPAAGHREQARAARSAPAVSRPSARPVGRPTVVNNVEPRWPLVPWIVANGAGAFRKLGDGDEPGHDARPGHGCGQASRASLEVPTGHVAARPSSRPPAAPSATLKAVLVGGPAGGFLPPTRARHALHGRRRSTRPAPSSGSGSVLVVDQTRLHRRHGHAARALPDRRVVRQDASRAASALRRLVEIGERFTGGRPRPTDAQLLPDLVGRRPRRRAVRPRASRRPIRCLSGMRYFADGVRGAHHPRHLPGRRLRAAACRRSASPERMADHD